MLELTKFIAKGATRLCFEHPENKDLCVKVIVRFKDEKLLERELKVYSYLKDELKDYIVYHQEQIVKTNLGKAIIAKLLRDDNGSYSKTLGYYYRNNKIDNEITSQLYHFAYKLVEHDIFFYDFNLDNFTIEVKDSKKKLYYTDIKSFERYKSWGFLRLEKVIPFIARYLMKKRLKKLFSTLNINM